MGIGTSSSSSGASAPRANAYAVNRDASELRRSPRPEGTGLSSAWPDACHLYVRGHRDTPVHSATRVLGQGGGGMLRCRLHLCRAASACGPGSRPVQVMDTELDQFTNRYAQTALIDLGVAVGRVRVETLEAFVAPHLHLPAPAWTEEVSDRFEVEPLAVAVGDVCVPPRDDSWSAAPMMCGDHDQPPLPVLVLPEELVVAVHGDRS